MVVRNRDSLSSTKEMHPDTWGHGAARQLPGMEAGPVLHFFQSLQGSLHLSASTPFVCLYQFACYQLVIVYVPITALV